MFIAKKIVSALLNPLPIALFLIILAVLFICRQRYKPAIISLSICLLLLFFTSTPFIVNPSTGYLEKRYPILTSLPSNSHLIVVLGAGTRGKYPTANQTLGNASLARVTEGIRLTKIALRRHQPIKLILSGGSLGKPTSANSMLQFAAQMGIPNKILVLENASLDTFEEAKLLQPLIKHHPFALVTSAVHMPRAIAVFRAMHMNPIAAPTQFSSRSYHDIAIINAIPSAMSAARFQQSWHEILGSLWYHIRGIT